MDGQVRGGREGPVGVLTIDRPESLNAFDLPMAHSLSERARAFADDPTVRAILLRGAGKHFCAGGDLRAISSSKDPSAYVLELARAANKGLEALRKCGKPVLAELQGAVAGGGVGVALAADLRIASADTRISLAFLKVGLTPDMGSTWVLPRIVGRGRAFEMAVSHDPLPIDEARQMGLVNRVVKPERLEEQGLAWARELALLPPLAVAELKGLLNAGEGVTFEKHLREDSEAIARMARTADFGEGAKAFFEKRAPRFEGR